MACFFTGVNLELFFKKKTPSHILSYEFREILQNNFFVKHFWTAAFVWYLKSNGNPVKWKSLSSPCFENFS